jgi:hypothetical protein
MSTILALPFDQIDGQARGEHAYNEVEETIIVFGFELVDSFVLFLKKLPLSVNHVVA